MFRCKMGVFQYVVIKVMLTIATFICVLTDSFGAGEMTNAEHGFVYVTVITNLSQLVWCHCRDSGSPVATINPTTPCVQRTGCDVLPDLVLPYVQG
jgi:hypothetical protein